MRERWYSGDNPICKLHWKCWQQRSTETFFLDLCFLIHLFSRLGRLRSGGAKGPGLFFILPCIDRWTSHLTIIPSPQATVYWWEQPLRWPISTNMQRAAKGKNKERKMQSHPGNKKCHHPGNKKCHYPGNKKCHYPGNKKCHHILATPLFLIPKWREDLLPDWNPQPHFIDTDLFPVTKRSTWEPCPSTFLPKRWVTNNNSYFCKCFKKS